MKTAIIMFTFAMLSVCSVFASPKFKGLNNKNGKTTIKVEIPSSELAQTPVIADWKLSNNGKSYDVKKVDVKGRNGEIFILEFKEFTEFSDCVLSFTINGEPVSIDIQSLMNR